VVFDAWLVATAIYVLLVARGNSAHDYYQLALLAPVCVIAGSVLARHARLEANLSSGLLGAALALTAAQSAAVYRTYLQAELRDSPALLVGTAAQAVTDQHSLVVAIAEHREPTALYHADRYGWVLRPDEASPERLAELAGRGATHALWVEKGTVEALARP